MDYNPYDQQSSPSSSNPTSNRDESNDASAAAPASSNSVEYIPNGQWNPDYIGEGYWTPPTSNPYAAATPNPVRGLQFLWRTKQPIQF